MAGNTALSQEALDNYFSDKVNSAYTNNNKALGINGAYATSQNDTSLTHDKLLNQTLSHINSAVMARKTYIIIPFTTFSPHTNNDIDMLLGVDNEERTHFNPTKGRWDEMFRESLGKEKTTEIKKPAYNDNGQPIMIPVYLPDGSPKMTYKLDKDGNPMRDENGAFIMEQLMEQRIDIETVTSQYEYYWCYYKGEHLPFGVLVSWDPNNCVHKLDANNNWLIDDNSGNYVYVELVDENLAMAAEKYPKFIFPDEYYIMPSASILLDDYEPEGGAIQLTSLIEDVFRIVRNKIDNAVANNQYYVAIMFSEINSNDTSQLELEFAPSEDETYPWGRAHTWGLDTPLTVYADKQDYDITVTIEKNKKYSIPELLYRALYDSPGTEAGATQVAEFKKAYREIRDPENKLMGFILQWYSKNEALPDYRQNEIENDIMEVINSFAFSPEGNEEILILSIYNKEHAKQARDTKISEMRTNYISMICDKIQSKLATAFNQSTNSAVILWTEISPTDPCSVAYEWQHSGYFTKSLQAQAYNSADQGNQKTLSKNTYTSLYEALRYLDIAYPKPSGSNGAANEVYWDYVYYKNIADKSYNGWDYSCGIAITYSDNGSTEDLNTLKEEYANTKDPAIKKNNTNYTQATSNGILRKITGYYTEVQKEIEALNNE